MGTGPDGKDANVTTVPQPHAHLDLSSAEAQMLRAFCMEESAEKSECRRESLHSLSSADMYTLHRTTAEERACAPRSTEERRLK